VIHSHYSLSAMAATIALFFISYRTHVVSLMGSDAQLTIIYKYAVKIFNCLIWAKTIVKSKQMLTNAGIKNALIIPNGVDIHKIEKIERKSLTIHNYNSNRTHKKTILFAADPGRESKNYTLAENAMKEINATLRVVYNKTHEKILSEILHADVVLLTSRWEGSPNIVKEAMACNCPIVATDVGDVRWLFGDEPGHYITSFDPEDVAEKIKQALEFSAKYGRTNGRQRIIELGLDSETVAKRIIGVYQEVLNKRKGSRYRKLTKSKD